jgi:hypothetical protein
VALGGRTGLHFQFPVVDRFVGGTVTSVKTMNLLEKTYQSADRIISTAKGYINKVADFASEKAVRYAGRTIRPNEVTGKALDLVVPPWITTEQRAALQEVVRYGTSKNVVVHIVEMK